jgi:hypothetical protein
VPLELGQVLRSVTEDPEAAILDLRVEPGLVQGRRGAAGGKAQGETYRDDGVVYGHPHGSLPL